MKVSLVMGLLCWPLAAQEGFLIPASFTASVGERISVRLELANANIADAGIYTSRAAYNLVNLRKADDAVVLDGSLKIPGTAVLAITTKPQIINRQRHTLIAKALVDVDCADANRYRSLALALELVLADPTHIMVLAGGLPVSGIEAKPLGIAGQDGRVTATFKPGIHKVSATRKVPSTDAKLADWDVITSTLTFEIR